MKKLKQYWDENPLLVIFVASLGVTAATGLINAVSGAHSRHAYAKQVNYRVKQ